VFVGVRVGSACVGEGDGTDATMGVPVVHAANTNAHRTNGQSMRRHIYCPFLFRRPGLLRLLLLTEAVHGFDDLRDLTLPVCGKLAHQALGGTDGSGLGTFIVEPADQMSRATPIFAASTVLIIADPTTVVYHP
jgi:hypothetical protein